MLIRFLEKLAEMGWLTAIVAAPIYFNIFTARGFEPDKAAYFRCLAAMVGVVFILRVALLRIQRPSGSGSIFPIVRRPLVIAALVLSLVQILSTLTSVAPGVSWWGSYVRQQGLYTFLAYGTIFLVMLSLLRYREQLVRIVNMALLVSVPISFYAVIQFLGRDPLPWAGDVSARVTSSFGQPVSLAAFLVMVLPLAVARWLDAFSRWRDFSPPDANALETANGTRLVLYRAILIALMNLLPVLLILVGYGNGNIWWMGMPAVAVVVILGLPFSTGRVPPVVSLCAYSGLLVVQFAAIVLTQSRGPWIGLAVGLGAIAVLLAWRWHRRGLLRGFVIFGLILVAFTALLNIQLPVMQAFRNAPYIGRLASIVDISSGTGSVRWLVWQGTTELLRTRPATGLEPDQMSWLRPVLGYGQDTMGLVLPKVYRPEIATVEARDSIIDRNHQVLLDYLTMSGIAGLVAFVALAAIALWQAWRFLWHMNNLREQLLLLGFVAGLISHLIETQVGIVNVSTGAYFWIYLAVIGSAGGLIFKPALPENPEAGDRAPTPLLNTRPQVATYQRDHDRLPIDAVAVAKQIGKTPIQRWTWPLLYLSLCIVCALALFIVPFWDDARTTTLLSFAIAALGVLVGAQQLCSRLPAPAQYPKKASNFAVSLMVGLAILGLGAIWVATLDVLAADVLFRRATVADKQLQWPTAFRYYQRALQLHPNQDWYYIYYGRAFLGLAEQQPVASGGANAARPTLNQVLTFDPARTQTLSRQDALEAAGVVFEWARQLSPLNQDHQANLGRLHRYWGVTLKDDAHLDYAINAFTNAVALSPRTPHLLNELSRTQLLRGDVNSALATAVRSVQLDSNYAYSYALLGDIHIGQGRWDEGSEAHIRAMTIDPASMADMGDRLALYTKVGRPAFLLEISRQAVDRDPENPTARNIYAFILGKQGLGREAAIQYRAVAELVPGDWLAYRNLAVTYQMLGMLPEAISATESALRYAPEQQRSSLRDFIGHLQTTRRP